MRIALDGSDLATERVEGPSVYAGELLPRLSRVLVERGHMVTTYAPAALRNMTVAGETKLMPGSPYWTQRVLPRALFRDRPDVLFLPIQMLPLVLPRHMRTVAVVHDLEFLKYPETYTWSNRLLLRFFTRHAVHAATQLIAVSQYTKDDVIRTYGRAADNITVVHHGVDHRRFQELRIMNTELWDDVRRRHSVPETFILFVGALQPRKNIVGLLMAYERLATMPQGPSPMPDLVLVSGGGWKEQPLLARIRLSPLRARIHVLRRVTHDELADCYRRASVFVLPSFSEGFGMPVLEAMASGVPVVTSDTSALPEVAGDAAILVDQNDPVAIAEAIRRVLRDGVLRRSLVEKGIERAQRFTWDRTAEQTANVIEQARHDASSTIEAGPR